MQAKQARNIQSITTTDCACKCSISLVQHSLQSKAARAEAWLLNVNRHFSLRPNTNAGQV